ncbi:hypothetical protein DPMN_011732 [Dreissena polymorpha]|uniref:MAM domain-containing protein n=1 Tax=Dreissena polymorpha TaxID=45954 RepID=A0A9D4S270_DREPO|nr:hypothetical protein DPMN_011732 [Dreissena polymorpha]
MIWSRSRTQGNVWRQGQRTINPTTQYELLFEAVVGYSWQGDIALDDISLLNQACPPPSKIDLSLVLGKDKPVYDTLRNFVHSNISQVVLAPVELIA